MKKTSYNKLELINRRLFYGVIALLPVWTFLSTWWGQYVFDDQILKAFIDVAIVSNLFLTLFLISSRVGVGRFFQSRLNRLIAVYFLLQLVFLPFYNDTLTSYLVGALFNLRFLAFFIVARYVTYKNKELFNRLLLWGIGTVAIFGTLQALVLPDDFLANFNYGPETIQPYLTIDSNADFVRINSFLRGPNPLGAFMAWSLVFLLALSLKRPKAARLVPFVLITLFFTFSRSAWLAAAVGLGLYMLAMYKDKIFRYKHFLVLAALLAIAGGIAFTRTSYFDVLVFHDDTTNNVAETSNTARLGAFEGSLEEISESPLGEGPGTSGPASRYGDTSEVNENYFLQVARDGGIVGLLVFISIIYLVIRNIYSFEPLSLAAVSAMAGFLLINLLLHAWADSTSTLLFWAFLGSRYKEKV